MFNKFNILIIFTFAAFLLVLPFPMTAEAYDVSGVVEFSYKDYETKIGDARTSDRVFIQNYMANINGFLIDPRLLKFNAGVGYAEYLYAGSGAPDAHTLSYNLHTSFFPGMKFSWDLYGNKNTSTIQSNSTIAGYDVTSTSYGGTLYLRLGSIGSNGNNNNNNNYNNNNNRGFKLRLPDITLSRSHNEMESPNPTSRIDETRDTTKMLAVYRPVQTLDILFDGTTETYKNNVQHTSYDTRTASATADLRLTPSTNLRLGARYNDQTTENLVGFSQKSTTHEYNATLRAQEQDRIEQFYTYSNTDQKSDAFDFTTQRAEGRITYRVTDSLRIRGGLNLLDSEYSQGTATSTSPEVTTMRSGAVIAGAAYARIFTPAFLGPFGINTAYDFDYGFSNIKGSTTSKNGSGDYYMNTASVGLRSMGWKLENASIDYAVMSKRDSSPLNNDIRNESVRAVLGTRRIPSTSISASGDYSVSKFSTENSQILLALEGYSMVQRRSARYDVNITHNLTRNLDLSAGAVRGTSSSTTSYTLSTLLQPDSSIVSEDQYYFASAMFRYPITRLLLYRAEVREELSTLGPIDTQRHIVNMNIDYRIRQILVTLEYKMRQTAPDQGLRETQTYYFAKISRPF